MSSEPTPTPSLSSEVMDSNPADDEAVREAEMIQGKRARFMQVRDYRLCGHKFDVHFILK